MEKYTKINGNWFRLNEKGQPRQQVDVMHRLLNSMEMGTALDFDTNVVYNRYKIDGSVGNLVVQYIPAKDWIAWLDNMEAEGYTIEDGGLQVDIDGNNFVHSPKWYVAKNGFIGDEQ